MKVIALALLFGFRAVAAGESYDPLKVPDVKIRTETFEVKDAKRDRTLPVRVYLPEDARPAPLVLFSHGLGGSRDNNPYLGNHWARRGYVVIFVQHPGSDESVWKEAPPLGRMAAMKGAASVENFTARAADIPAVLDQLEHWNSQDGHVLKGRMDMEHIGMSGHSFGAQTTQVVAGQSFVRARVSFLEKRIDAAVMMSPGPPAMGDANMAFSTITIPCLLMTGTKDDSPIGNSSAADRLKVFPALRNAPAWQIVFEGATHMDFGERPNRIKGNDDSRYHRAILALTTAFWDAQLKLDPKALKWLDGSEARSVLLDKDQWELNSRAKSSK